MRKFSMILAVAMIFSMLTVPSMAAESRIVGAMPDLSFNGTTATCTLSVTANTMDDEIQAIIMLYRGDTLINYWSRWGDGYLFFTESVDAVRGSEYTMSVTVYVNDELFISRSVTGTCK